VIFQAKLLKISNKNAHFDDFFRILAQNREKKVKKEEITVIFYP